MKTSYRNTEHHINRIMEFMKSNFPNAGAGIMAYMETSLGHLATAAVEDFRSEIMPLADSTLVSETISQRKKERESQGQ